MSKACTSMDKERKIDIFSVLANALLYPLTDFRSGRRRDDGATETAGTRRKRGLFTRFEHWVNTVRQRDIEAYLAQATDIYDLEARLRAMERNKSYPG